MEIISIPVIVALIEMFKRTGLPNKYAPITSLGLGVLLGLVFIEGDWMIKLGGGIILGLASSGLYSGTKATLTQ